MPSNEPSQQHPTSSWRWYVDSAPDNAGRKERLARCPAEIREEVQRLVRADIARRAKERGR